jgi:branched-chain amino acid transport system substrate-binding protein
MEEKMKFATVRLLVVLAVSVAMGSSVALAEKKYGPGVTDTEIKIGQTYPYSGPLSAYATIARAEAAIFAKINAEGGINGRKINFISLDDGYNPAKTVEQTRRLIEQDEVLLMFNPLGTPTSLAVIKYLNQRHIPHLFLATGASVFGDYHTYPWTMGLQPNYRTETHLLAKYIMKNLPDAKVGLLYQNDDSGRDFRQGVHEGFGDQVTRFIVKEVSYEPSDPTVDSQVISLQASGANVFLNLVPVKAAAQAIRKTASLGWRPAIFVSSISASIETVMKPAGVENAKGALSVAYLKDPADPAFKEDAAMRDHLALMQRYYPDGNPAEAANVYAEIAAGALIQVLKQCGDDLTRENVMRQADNLRDFAHPLLLPGIKIDTSPTDHYPIQQVQLIRFDGEKWVRFGELLSE